MKADRLLKIIYICLQHERVTIGALAEKMEVSRRTIFRDLETLSAAGIPIVTYPGAGGGVGIMDGFKLDKSLLTDDDFSKLTAALNSIHSVDGNKDTEMLMDKLIPADKRKVDGSDIIIDLSSWFESDETDAMFTDLRSAITAHRCVRLAYCRMREDFRMFKLARIFTYSILDEQFVPKKLGELVFRLQGEPEQKQPAGEAAVDILLEYNTQDKDRLIEKLGMQQFRDNGSTGTVCFSTTNPPWAVDLIISLQNKVKVLEPLALREEVQKRIRAMGEIYER